MWRIWALRGLEVLGIAVAVWAVHALVTELLVLKESRPTACSYLPTPDELVREEMDRLHDGTCRVVVKFYGTNAVLTLTAGECLTAIGAADRFLDREILSGPLGKDDL